MIKMTRVELIYLEGFRDGTAQPGDAQPAIDALACRGLLERHTPRDYERELKEIATAPMRREKVLIERAKVCKYTLTKRGQRALDGKRQIVD